MFDFQKIEVTFEVEKLLAELQCDGKNNVETVIISVADAIKHRCNSVLVNKKTIYFLNKNVFFEQLFKQLEIPVIYNFYRIFDELKINFIRSNPVLCNICKQNSELNDYIIKNMFISHYLYDLWRIGPGTSDMGLQDMYNSIAASSRSDYNTYYGVEVTLINNYLTTFKNIIDFSALCNPDNIRAKLFWKHVEYMIDPSYKTLDFYSFNKRNSFFRFFNEYASEIDWNSFGLLWNKKWIRLFIYNKVGQKKVNYTIPETEFRRFIENWRKYL